MKYLIALAVLFSSTFLMAQERPVSIPANVFDAPYNPPLELCKLLETRKEAGVAMDRSTLGNLTNNGVVVKWLSHLNKEYSQARHNHMLSKLHSDAFFECENFRQHYHLMFDSRNKENPEIVAQHREFLTQLHKEIVSGEMFKENALSALSQPGVKAFGELKYGYEGYTLTFYEYLPDSDFTYPFSDDIMVSKYTFNFSSDGISLKDATENEVRLASLLRTKVTHTPPPPPPSLKKN